MTANTPNYTLIELSQNQFAIVDDIDADLANVKWSARRTTSGVFYAVRRHNNANMYVHREVMTRALGRPLLPYPHEMVDHINGNGLDNRRENLRVATNAENLRNTRKTKRNVSGYKGVAWNKRAKKWTAQIKRGSQSPHLGYFNTAEEAHAAYCEAARLYHGKFANSGAEGSIESFRPPISAVIILPSPSCTLIKLSKGYYTTISKEDADLTLYKWHASVRQNHSSVYAVGKNGGDKSTAMHRVVMERVLGRPLINEEVVDHIDNDSLNNTRENLRVATFSQNLANSSKSSKNTSGWKGVCFHKGRKRWQATIGVEGRSVYLGIFDTPEEAHAAYCQAAKEHYGEFANFGKSEAQS
jgi:hypothetical protein